MFPIPEIGPPDVTNLIRLLSEDDLVDLAGKVAALQLMPENAARLVRLHVLAEMVAHLPRREGGRMTSRDRLRRLCNLPPLGKGELEAYEDPSEAPFTECITFIGGSYIVFPGIVENRTRSSGS